MRFAPFYFAGFAVLIGSRVEAQDPKGEESPALVLEKLKDFDSIFESGFTVSGTWRHQDVYRVRARLRHNVTRRWTLTFDGNRVGYRLNVTDYEKPAYRKELAEDPDAMMGFDVRTRQWGYWGSDLLGHHYEDTGVRVTPSGDVIEGEKTFRSSLYGTTDDSPSPFKRTVLWSLGRFFSKHIDQVTRVEQLPEGRLAVSALGKMSDRDRGRWELEIEPAAAWMVRKARFYWDRHPDEVGCEMTNHGTTWSGSHCIPEQAACNYFGPIEGPETDRFTFEPAVTPFDEKLYDEVRKAVCQNQHPDLTVNDHRVSPLQVYEPNRPKPIPPPTAPVSSGRKWILVLNLVILVFLSAYFLFRKRPNTNPPGNPSP